MMVVPPSTRPSPLRALLSRRVHSVPRPAPTSRRVRAVWLIRSLRGVVSEGERRMGA